MTLPCHPCPWRSACCRWGTWLTDAEGLALSREFGPAFVYQDLDTGRWRTQVWSGRCMFFKQGCIIHQQSNYPEMCRAFPSQRPDDPLAPRAFDAVTCPGVSDNPVAEPS